MKNLSTRFLYPLITIPDTTYDDMFIFNHLIGVFKNDLNNSGYIVSVYKDTLNITQFEKIIRKLNTEPVIELYRGCYILYHPIQKENERDYNLFCLGRYLAFSDNHKKKVMSFWKEKEYGIVYGIMYGTGIAYKYWEEKIGKDFTVRVKEKGLDLWPKPDKKEEIFDYKFIDSYLLRNCPKTV